MSTFPNSPRLLKGGIVLVGSSPTRIIGLQHNPDTLMAIWNRLRSYWIRIMPVLKRSLEDLVTRAYQATQKLVGKQTVLTAP